MKKATRKCYIASLCFVAVLWLGVLGGTAFATGQKTSAQHLTGFHGTFSEFRTIDPSGPSDQPDIDFVATSRWALRALRNNPRPNLDYKCRFSINLLRDPPGPGPDDHDPVTAGDTVTKLEPKGQKLPLYQQVPRVLPPLPE